MHGVLSALMCFDQKLLIGQASLVGAMAQEIVEVSTLDVFAAPCLTLTRAQPDTLRGGCSSQHNYTPLCMHKVPSSLCSCQRLGLHSAAPTAGG